jgi:uncharacterized protein (DUF362 family)
VLRRIKKLVPSELIVTGGSGAGETDEIFELVGLMDVVNEEGAVFFDHSRPPFVSVELKYRPQADVNRPQGSVMVNPRVLKYEMLISLAQLNLHETATVTLGIRISPGRFRRPIIMTIRDRRRSSTIVSSTTCTPS